MAFSLSKIIQQIYITDNHKKESYRYLIRCFSVIIQIDRNTWSVSVAFSLSKIMYSKYMLMIIIKEIAIGT